MTIVAAAPQLLYAATAAAYLLLAGLLVMSRSGGTVRTLLAIGCAATALWAAAAVAGVELQDTLLSNGVELVRMGAWCGLLLYLLLHGSLPAVGAASG